MLITCEDCDSRFQLDDRHMKEEGVKVKCSKCGKVFMAYAPSSVEMTQESATGIAIHLRFDIPASSLPDFYKQRLLEAKT